MASFIEDALFGRSSRLSAKDEQLARAAQLQEAAQHATTTFNANLEGIEMKIELLAGQVGHVDRALRVARAQNNRARFKVLVMRRSALQTRMADLQRRQLVIFQMSGQLDEEQDQLAITNALETYHERARTLGFGVESMQRSLDDTLGTMQEREKMVKTTGATLLEHTDSMLAEGIEAETSGGALASSSDLLAADTDSLWDEYTDETLLELPVAPTRLAARTLPPQAAPRTLSAPLEVPRRPPGGESGGELPPMPVQRRPAMNPFGMYSVRPHPATTQWPPSRTAMRSASSSWAPRARAAPCSTTSS